jgi:hypothetical protein
VEEMIDWYDLFIEKKVELLEDVDRNSLKVKRINGLLMQFKDKIIQFH